MNYSEEFFVHLSAKIEEFNTIDAFMRSRNINLVRYKIVGVNLFDRKDHLSVPIICYDYDKSTSERAYYTGFRFKNKYNRDIYFNLFKRNTPILKLQINEEIIIDDNLV